MHFNAKKNKESSYDDNKYNLISIDNLKIDSNSRITLTKRTKKILPLQADDIISVYQNKEDSNILFNIQRKEKIIDTWICKRIENLKIDTFIDNGLKINNQILPEICPENNYDIDKVKVNNITKYNRINSSAHTITSKKNVMIVDDDEDIVLMLKLSLESETIFNIDGLTSPVDALMRFTEKDPYYYDLVIVDIKMPQINGLRFYKIIERFQEHAKFLFISALEYAEEFLNLVPGFDKSNMMLKPIEPQSFIKKVKEKIMS